MLTVEIALYYLFAGLIILIVFFNFSAQLLRSLTISILIVFVSSEFWEIPIFLLAYLGFPGYQFPHVLHHILIGIMAVILVWLTKLKSLAGVALSGDLALNFLFLIYFPGVVSDWILRSLSLFSLCIVCLWSVEKSE